MSGSVLTLTLTAGLVYFHSTDVTNTRTGSVLIFTLKLKWKKYPSAFHAPRQDISKKYRIFLV